MAGVQRHLDMLAFNLASRGAATEDAYKDRIAATRVKVLPQAHQNFEQMQAYARDLLSNQIVNDSINLAVNCLNNAHLFLAVVKTNKEYGGKMNQEAQQKFQQAQQEFIQSQLDKKFNLLEENYGIMSELEDTITSMGFAIQALAQQGGIVREPQLDEQKELPLELKAAPAGDQTLDLQRQIKELETQHKVFREGEKIHFTDAELQSLLVTVAVFAAQIFNAVANYARDNHPGAS